MEKRRGPYSGLSVYTDEPEGNGPWEIWTLALDEGAEPEEILASAADARHAVFLPDGTWIDYESDETGENEVWVQEFPSPGDRRKVSAGEFAARSVWNEAGLYYTIIGSGCSSRTSTPDLGPRIWLRGHFAIRISQFEVAQDL